MRRHWWRMKSKPTQGTYREGARASASMGASGERGEAVDGGHDPRDELEVSRQPSDGEGGGGYEICIGLIDLP
jgi:hypothetical protein